jgi:hypothetical protein
MAAQIERRSGGHRDSVLLGSGRRPDITPPPRLQYDLAARMVARRYGLSLDRAALLCELAGIGGAVDAALEVASP